MCLAIRLTCKRRVLETVFSPKERFYGSGGGTYILRLNRIKKLNRLKKAFLASNTRLKK